MIRSLLTAAILSLFSRSHPSIRCGTGISPGEMPEEIITEKIPEPVADRPRDLLEIRRS
ncbi:hypothetical protein [Methanocalculus sp.]|uniref:hypothetical protein n=1 Tax=Methanocalculus sp. TaxID=2004547 RepID=UPI00180C0782|nr:hypothetical protein [Methanocalculus sp.]HIJ07570.1 hypothetical protein [Methanocalculus sp.]